MACGCCDMVIVISLFQRVAGAEMSYRIHPSRRPLREQSRKEEGYLQNFQLDKSGTTFWVALAKLREHKVNKSGIFASEIRLARR